MGAVSRTAYRRPRTAASRRSSQKFHWPAVFRPSKRSLRGPEFRAQRGVWCVLDRKWGSIWSVSELRLPAFVENFA